MFFSCKYFFVVVYEPGFDEIFWGFIYKYVACLWEVYEPGFDIFEVIYKYIGILMGSVHGDELLPII